MVLMLHHTKSTPKKLQFPNFSQMGVHSAVWSSMRPRPFGIEETQPRRYGRCSSVNPRQIHVWYTHTAAGSVRASPAYAAAECAAASWSAGGGPRHAAKLLMGHDVEGLPVGDAILLCHATARRRRRACSLCICQCMIGSAAADARIVVGAVDEVSVVDGPSKDA
jgi:hypothetical protein